MNILTDILPDCIYADGKKYPIKTDFRTWIKFGIIAEDGTAKAADMITDLIRLCFPVSKSRSYRLPSSVFSAVKALYEFYLCGSGNVKAKKKSVENTRPIFSFEQDSELIYAAFMQQYGIDLLKSDMHWWRFKALFSALGEDTMLHRVMSIRAADLSSISDKSLRAHYRRLKQIYALEDKRSEQEKEREIGSVLW